MFIQDNDLIDIVVYYKKMGKKYSAITSKEYEKLREDKKDGYLTMTCGMCDLTWGIYNELQDAGYVENASGERVFNIKRYKEYKLKRLIKKWDAVGSDGKPIPVTEKMILNLAPSIAECILRSYDETSMLMDEDEGK